MKSVYQTRVTSSGGRDGHVKSSDGLLDFDISLPKEMGGKATATNPEQMFGAGYAACYENALIHIAQQRKLTIGATSVEAVVDIGPNETGKFMLAIELRGRIAGVDAATGQDIMEAAHAICPYSSATRGNIDVKLTFLE